MKLKSLHVGQFVLAEQNTDELVLTGDETAPDEDLPSPKMPGEEEMSLDAEPTLQQAPGQYSLNMARDQLGGVLKNWMDLAGAYPEGEERHKFMELGERIQEVINKLETDFIR